LARPDAPVFLPEAEARPGLHHPCLGAEEIPREVRWLDVDHDAVRRVCPGMADAIPEGRPDPKVADAGKLAGLEPRLGAAALALPALDARRANRDLPRAAQFSAAAARCTQDEGRSAA